MSALALVGAFICSTSMFAGTKPAAGSAIAESTSQQGKITVKGKVIDQNGAPVIQASVLQRYHLRYRY